MVFSDHGFHSKEGDPTNLKVCEPFDHNERMIVETVLSMLTTICHFKKVMHRVWDYFQARLAFTMAVFNLLVSWDGFHPDPDWLRSPVHRLVQLMIGRTSTIGY